LKEVELKFHQEETQAALMLSILPPNQRQHQEIVSRLEHESRLEEARDSEILEDMTQRLPKSPESWRSRHRDRFDEWEDYDNDYNDRLREFEAFEDDKRRRYAARDAELSEERELVETGILLAEIRELALLMIRDHRLRTRLMLDIVKSFRRRFPIPDPNQKRINLVSFLRVNEGVFCFVLIEVDSRLSPNF
jgi:hypothetical protein